MGCLLHSDEPLSSKRAQEDIGLIDKGALYPFGRPHEATTFCFSRVRLKQSRDSTQHQNTSLDPINYRTYQIFYKCFHFIVMLNYTLAPAASVSHSCVHYLVVYSHAFSLLSHLVRVNNLTSLLGYILVLHSRWIYLKSLNQNWTYGECKLARYWVTFCFHYWIMAP